MRRIALAILVGLVAGSPRNVLADAPDLTSWLLNTTGLTGYNGLPANVQRIRYSHANVYVNCSGIPAYAIGPWPGNPNVAANQGYLLKFPRSPVVNTGTKTNTPLGPIGVWINGVPLFNSLDARSYNNQNVWHQNAVFVEASSFDACLGHPAPGGVYHHHQNPSCLSDPDSTRHSRILGWAFDGYPVYGPFGYRNADGTGSITRMRSSYRPRAIAQRTTLPDGMVLSPAQYGPAVSTTYPLGYYAEDFEFATGLGDLDASNGRFGVTPEYPGGAYAYYVTIDAGGASAYSYVIGPEYHGVVTTENITSHGHVTITEAVTDYVPTPVDVSEFEAGSHGGSVFLGWRLSAEALAGLIGIRVQRGLAAAGPYGDIGAGALEPAAMMRFQDPEPESGHEYWYRLRLSWSDGSQSTSSPLGVRVDSSPGTALYEAFEPRAGGPVRIHYRIGVGAEVQLAIYDARGRRVAALERGFRPTGDYARLWDRRDDAGMPVDRGVYFVRLATGTRAASRKVVLLHR